MTAFDSTIRIGEIGVQPVEDENGSSYEAHLILGVISLLNVGPGQVVPLPLGVLRAPLGRDALKGLHKEIGDVLEIVKDRPDITIANSLAGVEQAAGQPPR
jgi:hypothetical protein